MAVAKKSQRPQPRAVLWDLDGTLIDSAVLHWQAWRDELLTRGRTLSFEEFLSMFGQRNDTTLRAWIRPDLTQAEIDAISLSKEIRFRRSIGPDGLSMLPGAEDLLAALRSAGWRQALATMAGFENVNAVFGSRQDRFFDAVVTAEDVVHGKPAPDVFLKAAEKLGVPVSRCIVVEDSQSGIEAARRAGMKSIGIGPNTQAADRSCLSVLEIPEGAFDQLVP